LLVNGIIIFLLAFVPVAMLFGLIGKRR
jgi:hypothetical protein